MRAGHYSKQTAQDVTNMEWQMPMEMEKLRCILSSKAQILMAEVYADTVGPTNCFTYMTVCNFLQTVWHIMAACFVEIYRQLC